MICGIYLFGVFLFFFNTTCSSFVDDSIIGQPLEIYIFDILSAMKLFEQSLSGLEIITGELNELIIDALLDDYYSSERYPAR